MTAIQILIDMAWRSAFIAGVALAGTAALRGYAPRYRAALCYAAIIILLALPLMMLVLPKFDLAMLASPDSGQIAHLGSDANAAPTASVDPARFDFGTIASVVYVLGMAGLLGHLAVGLGLLARLTRRASAVTSTEWLDTLTKLRAMHGMRNIELRCSDVIGSPLSWGWLRPSILIDRDSFERQQLARGILAHELAHIARHDWPLLIAARVALALFWFNPLVWVLTRRTTEFAEQAADASVVREMDRLAYARTLTRCAQAKATRRPATAMAASPTALTQRIRILVDDHLTSMRQGMALPALIVIACTGTGVLLASANLTSRAGVSRSSSVDPSVDSQPATNGARLQRHHSNRALADPAGHAPRRAMAAPEVQTAPTQASQIRLQAANGASEPPPFAALDRQGQELVATKLGDLETERGLRRAEFGDVMTRRGAFPTKRGEIMTRLGEIATEAGEERNRRVAARLREADASADSGGPAP